MPGTLECDVMWRGGAALRAGKILAALVVLVLALAQVMFADTVYWDGSGQRWWNTEHFMWTNEFGVWTNFATGDAAVFNGRSEGDVYIDPAGVAPLTASVTAGSYQFGGQHWFPPSCGAGPSAGLLS